MDEALFRGGNSVVPAPWGPHGDTHPWDEALSASSWRCPLRPSTPVKSRLESSEVSVNMLTRSANLRWSSRSQG
jgi:hypothetical protein